jgi:hypothetical protein
MGNLLHGVLGMLTGGEFYNILRRSQEVLSIACACTVLFLTFGGFKE